MGGCSFFLCAQDDSNMKWLLTGIFANSLSDPPDTKTGDALTGLLEMCVSMLVDKLMFVNLLADMYVYASRKPVREHIWMYSQFAVMLFGRTSM